MCLPADILPHRSSITFCFPLLTSNLGRSLLKTSEYIAFVHVFHELVLPQPILQCISSVYLKSATERIFQICRQASQAKFHPGFQTNANRETDMLRNHISATRVIQKVLDVVLLIDTRLDVRC